MTVTANDEPTEIEADVDKRFSSIVVNLPVQQTGTGTPSPSNPRPFTMWTDVSLYVSDTEEADEPTLAIELPTPMYGGKVDMVRGEIATTYNSKESGTGWEMTEEGQFRCQVSAYNNGDETSTDVADLYAVHYDTVSNKDAYDATDDLTCGLATIAGTTYLYVNDAQYTTLESFATHIADEVFVFRAHIPMSDVTEPHIVYLPAGTSYVWADAGFVDLTVSGTPPLSLPNSLGKPLKAWSVDVLPYQEGTGDPSPDNVRPIYGTDKLTITTAGKNLCPDKLYQNSATAVYIGQDNAIDYPFALIAGQTYTISAVNTVSPDVYLREENDQQGVLWGNGLPKSFTPSVTGNYRIALAKGSGISVDDFSDVQLEFGSTASSYTPYLAPSQTVLTLPQTVYTGTIGSEGGESRCAMVDMGEQNWIYHSVRDVFYYVTPDGKPTGTGRSGYGMCEAYKVMEGTPYVNLTDGQAAVGTNFSSAQTASVVVKDSRFTDAAQFKAAVSGIKLVYEIADSVQFPLTAPPIPTPTGTATTWATAEDGTVDGMEVTYVGKA